MAFYKKGFRSNIQLYYPFELRRLLEPKFGWKFPVAVQPKLDGERSHPIAHILPDIELISSECNLIISVPHINYAMKEQKINKELDGELYVHGMEFSDIHSIVSRKSEETIHPEAYKMQFHCFDIAWPNGPQAERLVNIPVLESPLFRVETNICHDVDEIMYYYDKYKEMGYEGIVVRELRYPYERKRTRFGMKFKPKKIDDYLIVGVNEAISESGERKSMIGAFTCVGVDLTEFNVGAGELKHHQRIAYWQDHIQDNSVIGKYCRVQYQSITTKGKVPRFGLAVEVIE